MKLCVILLLTSARKYGIIGGPTMVPMARISGKSTVIINKFSNGFLCKITKKIPKSHLCAPHMLHMLLPAVGARAGRFFARKPHMQNFFLESQGAARPDHFPGITTQACQNLPHMHKPYGRSYSVVNPEEQRLLTRNDVHMVDFYLKFCYNIIGGNIFSDR